MERNAQLLQEARQTGYGFSPTQVLWSRHRTEQATSINRCKEMLIVRVNTGIQVCYLRGRQRGYSGHVINFPQEVHKICLRHPQSAQELKQPNMVTRGETAERYSDFDINACNLKRWLTWVKANNLYYNDIQIDDEGLRLIWRSAEHNDPPKV